MKLFVFLLLFVSLNVFGQSGKEGEYNSLEVALLVPENVKSLDLSDKGLKVLPIQLEQFSNLTKIDIGSNPDLDLVQAFGVLSKLKNLKNLWLTDSKISDLPVQIKLLKRLEELWLNDNMFSEVPNSIKKLGNLKYVSFFSNNIKTLSLEKGDFPILNQINLCYNKFQFFPTQLSILPQLKRIVIWGDSMTVVPNNIKHLKNIEEINMELNHITSFPKGMSKLKRLKKLTVWNNNLTEEGIMPLYKLKRLEVLDIRQNNISYILPKIKKLTYLSNLTLSSNPLSKLPAELSQLKALRQLGLGELSAMDWVSAFSIMGTLPNLRRVGMYSMKLSRMPVGFDKLKQVEVFWMNYNSFDKNERARIKTLLPKADIDFN